MTKLNIFLLILSAFFIWLLITPQTADQSAGLLDVLAIATTPTPLPSPTPSPTLTPVPQPAVLIIPKLNINTTVESVGTDSLGRMDVPHDFNNVGWYRLGPSPGDQGSAVISGHLDRVTGAPAIFYDLAKLETGDTVTVIDENSMAHNFRVVYKTNYNYDQVPLDLVFNSGDRPRLNLITCGGSWNVWQHNYSQRVVIYTISTD